MLGILSQTRQEFETGAAALQESERQQESEFQASKTSSLAARAMAFSSLHTQVLGCLWWFMGAYCSMFR